MTSGSGPEALRHLLHSPQQLQSPQQLLVPLTYMGWGSGSPSPAKTLTFPVSSCIPSSFSAIPATTQVSSRVYLNFLKSWGDMVWNTFLFLRRLHSQELRIFKNALSTWLPISTHAIIPVSHTFTLWGVANLLFGTNLSGKLLGGQGECVTCFHLLERFLRRS